LGGVISTLPNSSFNNEFAYAAREESCQTLIMATAATLPDAIAGATSGLVEIQGELIALNERFVANLAGGIAKRLSVQVRKHLLVCIRAGILKSGWFLLLHGFLSIEAQSGCWNTRAFPSSLTP